ncbi:MAG: ABC transporter substrate-binding protein [Burkholderiaceae bacterium]
MQIFAGLVLVDDKFQATPYLATRWEKSADGLSYTFHLVDGATFHDGKPITSEDVAFSLDVVQKNHPFGQAMFGNVDKVETPDARTAVFRLSKPIPGLLLSLQPLLMPILPKHVLGDGQDIKKHPRNMDQVIGSGPFKVVENNPAQQLVLARNEQFFIKDRPLLDGITYQMVKDPLSRMLMLEKGELDYAGFSGMRPKDVERLEKVPGMSVTTSGYEAIGYIHYLELNLRKKPFDDIRVRQALAHTIDPAFIAKVLFAGRAAVGTGPLHTGNPYYTNDVPRYPADLKKAAALLDEAGYPLKNGERFGFTLDVGQWAPQTHDPIAEYLRAQLGKVGIKVELRRAPDFGTWVSRVSSFEYEAKVNGSFNYPDPVIGVHRHFSCANIRNVIWANTQGYCDKTTDALLDQAAIETDETRRKGLYADLQKKIVSDLVFIYLPEEFTTTAYGSKVQGLPNSAFGPLSPMHEVWLKAN